MRRESAWTEAQAADRGKRKIHPFKQEIMPYCWLLLVRHGRTEANRQGIYAGDSKILLDDLGRQQAQSLGKRLSQLKVSAIYSSPVARAVETAAYIAAQTQLSITELDALTELKMPAWQGLAAKEIEAKHPVEWYAWTHNPAALDCSHIESLRSVAARSRKVVHTLGQKHPGQAIAVVAHEAVIRAMILTSLKMDLRHYRDFRIAPGSLSILGWKPDDARLMLLSDTSHQELGRFCFLASLQ